MKQSIKDLLHQDKAEKLLIELILALEHIGLDYKKVVETYREAIRKPLEETPETQEDL